MERCDSTIFQNDFSLVFTFPGWWVCGHLIYPSMRGKISASGIRNLLSLFCPTIRNLDFVNCQLPSALVSPTENGMIFKVSFSCCVILPSWAWLWGGIKAMRRDLRHSVAVPGLSFITAALGMIPDITHSIALRTMQPLSASLTLPFSSSWESIIKGQVLALVHQFPFSEFSFPGQGLGICRITYDEKI